MELNEYQEKASKTVVYPQVGGLGYIFPALGIAGEVGEVVERMKKMVRDPNTRGAITDQDREEMKGELGDVLWYISQIAREFDVSLEDIAEVNLKKIEKRLKEGSINEPRR